MKIEKNKATKYMPIQKRNDWNPPIEDNVLRFIWIIDLECFQGIDSIKQRLNTVLSTFKRQI